ncbi:hypothetical protein HPB51_012798 [Rhipicephalus microplus]|uniref:Uncharacterized protein n=2 Tax=Rhipicephalus microplus TaxID=6941 RepID=A0A9J6D9N7_RHIMP|nr:hypothetical protein HPB51_012798 [Rhipicephalus microplus]
MVIYSVAYSYILLLLNVQEIEPMDEIDSGESALFERPRNAVLLGCSAASMLATATGLFAAIFLHPALVLVLVFGNATSVALAMRFGYRAYEPPTNNAKASACKTVVPVIQIHPPNMTTEL